MQKPPDYSQSLLWLLQTQKCPPTAYKSTVEFLKLHFFLFLPDTSILLELKSLNLSFTKEGCDASPAPFNFTELETNFITKLKSLEQRFDEKRNSLQKMEEQLLRIEIKLNRLQNCRGKYEKQINMSSGKTETRNSYTKASTQHMLEE